MIDTTWLDRDLPPSPRKDAAVRAALRDHATHGGAAARGPEDLALCGCLTSLVAGWLDDGKFTPRDLGDREGERLPTSLPPVTDAHVHAFPDPVFEALWRWFDAYAWPIRYKLRAPEVTRFLLDRGVDRLFLLQYAHKPGMARALNPFMAELCRDEPRLVGFATVLPGEPDVRSILAAAAALGLRAVKLHCHVQGFAIDSEPALEVLAACRDLRLPVLVHAGREPRSPRYEIDPYTTCHADRVETVLRAFPTLKICVPHFGADEYEAYGALLDRYDHLYVDTAMMLAGYFPVDAPASLVARRPERVLFGTDFPGLPYAWDREVRRLAKLGLSDAALESVLSGAATSFLEPST